MAGVPLCSLFHTITVPYTCALSERDKRDRVVSVYAHMYMYSALKGLHDREALAGYYLIWAQPGPMYV